MWRVERVSFIHLKDPCEGEPFAITDRDLVWLKTEVTVPPRENVVSPFHDDLGEVHFTPEAQKIQDDWEAKLKKGKLTMNVDPDVLAAQDERQAIQDTYTNAIRIQAIKDVGKALDNRVEPIDVCIRTLLVGKIPE